MLSVPRLDCGRQDTVGVLYSNVAEKDCALWPKIVILFLELIKKGLKGSNTERLITKEASSLEV